MANACNPPQRRFHIPESCYRKWYYFWFQLLNDSCIGFFVVVVLTMFFIDQDLVLNVSRLRFLQKLRLSEVFCQCGIVCRSCLNCLCNKIGKVNAQVACAVAKLILRLVENALIENVLLLNSLLFIFDLKNVRRLNLSLAIYHVGIRVQYDAFCG